MQLGFNFPAKGGQRGYSRKSLQDNDLGQSTPLYSSLGFLEFSVEFLGPIADDMCMIRITNRRATGLTWISDDDRSSYIDIGKPGSAPLAVVNRVKGDYSFTIEIRGEEVEVFRPPVRKRRQPQAEARALELL